MKELTCDKCGSHDIEDTVIDFPHEKVETIKMSEYKGISQNMIMPAVVKFYRHRLTCRNCGFNSEYTN